jgi:hypothetical protein
VITGLKKNIWTNEKGSEAAETVIGMKPSVLYKASVSNFRFIEGYAMVDNTLLPIQTTVNDNY